MNRNKFVLTIFLFSLLIFPLHSSEFPEDVLSIKNAITGDMILSHIDFLASKYCRGRETGDIGMEVASKYITSILKGAGLEPAGDYGGYLQEVKLQKVSLGKGIYLKIEEKRSGASFVWNAKLEWDFLPVSFSSQRAVSAPIVFVGYGITAPEHNYDDYKNLNAAGKIVLVMRHEPGENEESSPFEGRRNSIHGTLLTKILNAQKHGAVGVLFVTDPLNHKDLSPAATGGTRWASLVENSKKDDEDFRFMKFSPPMRIVGDDFGVRIPAAALDGKLIDELLGDEYSLLDIQEEIDKKMMPRSFALPNKQIHMGMFFQNEPVKAFNIAAKVQGSDPELKQEVVIVGGHFDHVGKDNRGLVFAGADDNASGISAVMELARAFQNLKEKPKRTILFILFTAEEKGLLGSRYYVDNPILPLEKTVAMINLDMIGRNDTGQISLIGRYQYPKLYELVEPINKQSANFELNFAVEGFIKQSDHFPFMRKDIPCITLNSGMHDTLHRPEDTADRIIPDKAQMAAQFVFLSLWKIANLPPGTSLK
ncbi:M20/M25/M40 family metallo-hydrolase [Acidobacteriota bacterium]